MKKERKKILFQSEIIATLCIIALIIILSSILFSKIYSMAEQRCWNTLEENTNQISTTISDRILEDRKALTVLSHTISDYDSIHSDNVNKCIASFTPLTISTHIALLLPDNQVILQNGTVAQNSQLSFEKEVTLGQHTSDREKSVINENQFIVRNFVPVEKNGEIIAMLFGEIDLQMLSADLNFNDYDGNGAVYLFDGNTGDDIINTWHSDLGNAYERGHRPVKQGYDYEKMQIESLGGATGHIVFVSKSIGEYLYYYYAPVNINNWTMALSVPESVVFKDALIIKNILIIFVGIQALLLLCYLAWMLWHVKRITEKEREQNVILEDALERAEHARKAKSLFLSNMSHDIRTPMNAIVGFTAIANSCIDEKERVQDCLNKITSSSNHLLALINDVLDMSKIESGKIRLQEDEGNLSEVMHNFMNIIQSQVSNKKLDLLVDSLDITHENVYMDSLRFNQVLLNIVGNSIKYTEPGGSIIIRISEQPSDMNGYGNYTIFVKDTGIGMSEEYLPHIFEVFTREKSSTVNKIEGTGLGLPITKHIVDIMGGTISVESKLGEGTQFTITIPLKLQDENIESPYFDQLSGIKILNVNKDLEICNNISRMLQNIGMIPTCSLSGDEAISCAMQAKEMGEQYSAYVIDWKLPDINGIELVKKIRQIDGKDAPIFILTDYNYCDFEHEARKAGATAFCQKPVFMSNLKKMLLETYGLYNKPVEKSEKSENCFAGKRFLLAEDNELNREIVAEILKGTKCIFETAVNGKIAVDLIKASKPGYYDAILMDVHMPVMDGYQATREIRKLSDKKLAAIPIVAMTASAFEEDKQEALNNGMDAHIAKPVDYEIIIMTLKKVLNL